MEKKHIGDPSFLEIRKSYNKVNTHKNKLTFPNMHSKYLSYLKLCSVEHSFNTMIQLLEKFNQKNQTHSSSIPQCQYLDTLASTISLIIYTLKHKQLSLSELTQLMTSTNFFLYICQHSNKNRFLNIFTASIEMGVFYPLSPSMSHIQIELTNLFCKTINNRFNSNTFNIDNSIKLCSNIAKIAHHTNESTIDLSPTMYPIIQFLHTRSSQLSQHQLLNLLTSLPSLTKPDTTHQLSILINKLLPSIEKSIDIFTLQDCSYYLYTKANLKFHNIVNDNSTMNKVIPHIKHQLYKTTYIDTVLIIDLLLGLSQAYTIELSVNYEYTSTVKALISAKNPYFNNTTVEDSIQLLSVVTMFTHRKIIDIQFIEPIIISILKHTSEILTIHTKYEHLNILLSLFLELIDDNLTITEEVRNTIHIVLLFIQTKPESVTLSTETLKQLLLLIDQLAEYDSQCKNIIATA